MTTDIPTIVADGSVSAVRWLADNGDAVDARLRTSGALRFEGFGLDDVRAFEEFALGSCAELYRHNAEHTSVSPSGNVQTPVAYSARRKLLWHNENTFNEQWPGRLLFACATPPDSGGETPIVDGRSVHRALPGDVTERFAELGITYQRTYGTGVGVPWQQVFHTDDPRDVERQCTVAGIEYEWCDGGRLRTRQTCPAIVRHPETGEAAWVGQPQHWHPSCLDPTTRSSLVAVLGVDGLPRTCYFGDGSPIPDGVMRRLCETYERLEVAFPWRRGAALLIDNLLTAHARNPYTGPRKLLVAMGRMRSFRTLAGTGRAGVSEGGFES